jgi:3-oxoacyl-[acyl-carrier-protein] synthase II
MIRANRRRVAVTGVGAASPIGCSREQLWKALIEQRSGIAARPCASRASVVSFAGEARDFQGRIRDFAALGPNVERELRKALKVMNRETQIAICAGQQALAESGLLDTGAIRERIGVCFGAENVSLNPGDFQAAVRACTDDGGRFDFERWGADGLPEIAPLWLLKCLPNLPACYLAMLNDLRGPNNSITAGSVSAGLAVAEACRLIQDGDADAVLTGATGTMLEACNLVHALLAGDVANTGGDPAAACRPFDSRRTGFVPAEGSAAIMLEELQTALRRGAPIYGEILACTSGHAVGPSGQAQSREALGDALRMCLDASGLDPASVGHVHAHGLSTRQTDADEAQAIRDVFGSAADRLPIVAAKSSLGNAGAGAGALELVTSLLALRYDRLFPVLNYEVPDPECPIRPVTRHDVAAGQSFLKLSLDAEGQASCVAVRAWELN